MIHLRNIRKNIIWPRNLVDRMHALLQCSGMAWYPSGHGKQLPPSKLFEFSVLFFGTTFWQKLPSREGKMCIAAYFHPAG